VDGRGRILHHTVEVDPIDLFVSRHLVLMFATLYSRLTSAPRQKVRAFCAEEDACFCVGKPPLVNGTLNATRCSTNSTSGRMPAAHGFMHITSLRFYRQARVQKWLDAWVGDAAFAREFDDQGAITVPAAAFAPQRSWDMWSNGVALNVMHNMLIDGRGFAKIGSGGAPGVSGPGFKNYWRTYIDTANSTFTAARSQCRNDSSVGN